MMLPPPDQLARIWNNMSQSDRLRIMAAMDRCEGSSLDILI